MICDEKGKEELGLNWSWFVKDRMGRYRMSNCGIV